MDASPQCRPLTRADYRFDVVLAIVVFVGALISAALSSIAGVYGAEQQSSMGLAIGYAAVISLPLAFRRRWPSVVAVIVALAYFAAVSLRIPETFAGSIAMFVAIYTVGAWSTDRRRARIVRVALIAGMFLWLLVTMFMQATAPTDIGISRTGSFSPFVAVTLLNLMINPLYFGGAYYLGDRAWNSALPNSKPSARSPPHRPSPSIASVSRVSCTMWSRTTCRLWACRPVPPARSCSTIRMPHARHCSELKRPHAPRSAR